MTTIDTTTTTVEPPSDDFVIDDAQLAAAAFLARYSGRTLDAYRHDLRMYRLGSGTVPYGTHPDLPHLDYRRQLDEAGEAVAALGRKATRLGLPDDALRPGAAVTVGFRPASVHLIAE